MLADAVKCCWCDWFGVVPTGEDICPNCKREGYLVWQDDNEQEVEI